MKAGKDESLLREIFCSAVQSGRHIPAISAIFHEYHKNG